MYNIGDKRTASARLSSDTWPDLNPLLASVFLSTHEHHVGLIPRRLSHRMNIIRSFLNCCANLLLISGEFIFSIRSLLIKTGANSI